MGVLHFGPQISCFLCQDKVLWGRDFKESLGHDVRKCHSQVGNDNNNSSNEYSYYSHSINHMLTSVLSISYALTHLLSKQYYDLDTNYYDHFSDEETEMKQG